MKKVHLANTEFERCFKEGTKRLSLNPFERLLRFLPCAYVDEDEGVLVEELPTDSYYEQLKPLGSKLSKEQLLTHYEGPIDRWGEIPDSLQHLVNKAWVKPFAPPEAECILLETDEQFERWFSGLKNPALLREPYSLSGRGHRLIEPGKRIPIELPMIATQWLPRTLDFSSQWKVGERVELLGVTEMMVGAQNQYIGSRTAGRSIPQLDSHLKAAKEALTKAQKEGFRGHAGVDAFLFGDDQLYPIVEINFRKTLAWFLLKLQSKYYPEQPLELCFGDAAENGIPLLPTTKKSKQLFLRCTDS